MFWGIQLLHLGNCIKLMENKIMLNPLTNAVGQTHINNLGIIWYNGRPAVV